MAYSDDTPIENGLMIIFSEWSQYEFTNLIFVVQVGERHFFRFNRSSNARTKKCSSNFFRLFSVLFYLTGLQLMTFKIVLTYQLEVQNCLIMSFTACLTPLIFQQ